MLPHFSLVPERYFRATDATRILFHLGLLRQRDADGVAVGWQEPPGGHGTEFTVVAPDRRGLFASLAGTFTARGVDVLSVDLFTREDGVALDTFRVARLPEHAPLESDRCERLQRDLAAAAAGRLDVEAAVEKWRAAAPRRTRRHWGRARHEPRVKFDAEGSATATIVEVRAPDRPGLAYLIAHTLVGPGARHLVRQDRDGQGPRVRRVLRDGRQGKEALAGRHGRGRRDAAARAGRRPPAAGELTGEQEE